MNIFHECRSEKGGGHMLAYQRTDKRIPYRPGIHEWKDAEPADPSKPVLAKYWQPLFCRHCGSAVFELVEPEL